METPTEIKNTGCGQAAVIATLLLWLAIVPIGAMAAVELVQGEAVVSPLVVIVATALLLLLPAVGVALLTRRRAGWGETAAVAASVATIAGYLVLEASIRALLPQGLGEVPLPPLQASPSRMQLGGQQAILLQLGILLPYVFLAGWLAPRLAGRAGRPLTEWLGLHRLAPSTLLLALALAALLTIPWPLTGALGDRFTSLDLTLQTLTWAIPHVLIFWGVVFALQNSTFRQSWLAALTTILLYTFATFAAVLPSADWGALSDVLLLVPLGILLTELRARRSGIYPLLPVALCYRLAPLLFVDPRDVIANLVLEPQHIASHAIAVVLAGVFGLGLWGGRRLILALRDGKEMPAWTRLTTAAMVLIATWATWGGLYNLGGMPGFADDGFLIILEEQADLEAAYALPDRPARQEFVYQALVETAERTQAPLRAELDELGLSYRPYYIINMIRVDGHRWLMSRFAGRPGVAQVLLNPNVRDYPNRAALPYDEGEPPSNEIQLNLSAIHADEAWALGVTGAGIVVAGQDTGYDWTHPALWPHYRGWDGQTADHDYNWHDAWDHTVVPFDDDSHGTHTMGTVLGDDGDGNRPGVAPGAQWIGCRNMRRGFGNPGSYAECMEFFLAPYPHGGDPFRDGHVDLSPHVVNNSWGCPGIEGCFPDTLELAAEALRAAGIMMVVSAGNDGPACATASTPPANYDAVFSIGATNSDGDITNFSSRGPVGGLIKPDVSAPGASVRSSVPGGGYGYAGGTSMAGPHVAGLVALLWSANPALVGDIATTEALICQTAVPRPVDEICTIEHEVSGDPFAALFANPICACGDVTGVPNNVYGCGFIDAGAAVREALGE